MINEMLNDAFKEGKLSVVSNPSQLEVRRLSDAATKYPPNYEEEKK
jgi:hypothetical protein